MATEASGPRVSPRRARSLSRLVAHSILGSSVWLATSALLPNTATAQEPSAPAAVTPEPVPQAPSVHEATPEPPPDVVQEVTVRGNKAEALKRASGSGTTIGEREIKNAQP